MLKYFVSIIPLVGTSLGAFLGTNRSLYNKLQKQENTLVAVATGILCSIVFNLLLESIEFKREPTVYIGIAIGFLFSILLSLISKKKNLSVKSKVFWAMLIHNIPEGIVVGISLADNKILPSTILVVLSISLQNIPDGLVVSMPMVSTKGRMRAFLYGFFSGVVEPIFAYAIILTAGKFSQVLMAEPLLIGFSFSMILMIAIELLKECESKKIVIVTAIATIIFNCILG